MHVIYKPDIKIGNPIPSISDSLEVEHKPPAPEDDKPQGLRHGTRLRHNDLCHDLKDDYQTRGICVSCTYTCKFWCCQNIQVN